MTRQRAALAQARGSSACVVGGGGGGVGGSSGGGSGGGGGVPFVDCPLGAGILRAVLLQRGVDDPEELQREVHRHLARRQHELLELSAAADGVAWVSIRQGSKAGLSRSEGAPGRADRTGTAAAPRVTRRATQLDEHVRKLRQVKLDSVERRWVREHALQLAGRLGDSGSLAAAAPQGEHEGL